MNQYCRVSSESAIYQQNEFVAEAIEEKIQREVIAEFNSGSVYDLLYDYHSCGDPFKTEKVINAKLQEFVNELFVSKDPVRALEYFKTCLIEKVVAARIEDVA